MKNNFIHDKDRLLLHLFEGAKTNKQKGFIHDELSKRMTPNTGYNPVPITEDLSRQDAENNYKYYANAVENNINKAQQEEETYFDYLKKAKRKNK